MPTLSTYMLRRAECSHITIFLISQIGFLVSTLFLRSDEPTDVYNIVLGPTRRD